MLLFLLLYETLPPFSDVFEESDYPFSSLETCNTCTTFKNFAWDCPIYNKTALFILAYTQG
jgi:hypothetical protein